MTLSNNDASFVITAPSRGTIQVDPARARCLAVALATGDHPWLYRGPLALPEGDDPVTEADDLQNEGHFAKDEVASFWRPIIERTNQGWKWRPWLERGRENRYVEITRNGEISWSSGTGSRSRFIGGLLVAAAGGLAQLPLGLMEFGFEGQRQPPHS